MSDWAVLSVEGMDERIEKACGDIVRRFQSVVDLEDLEQEARLIVVSHAPRVRGYLADADQGWSHVSRWLWSKLRDFVQREIAVQNRQIDYALLKDE